MALICIARAATYRQRNVKRAIHTHTHEMEYFAR